MKISQSMFKAWIEYLDGKMCGSVFEAKYITKKWYNGWSDSHDMALGRYFEYKLTGAIPTGYDKYPLPGVTAKVRAIMKVNKNYIIKPSDITPDYKLADENAQRVKSMLRSSGITTQRAQAYRENRNLDGHIDIEAESKDLGEINIDVKYSGLIDDYYKVFGWRWTQKQMDYNKIQSRHYTLLNGKPTYFLAVSNKNNTDIAFMEARSTSDQLSQHEETANNYLDQVNFAKNNTGFTNFPTLRKCVKCPLKSSCKDAVSTLVPEIILITDNN